MYIEELPHMYARTALLAHMLFIFCTWCNVLILPESASSVPERTHKVTPTEKLTLQKILKDFGTLSMHVLLTRSQTFQINKTNTSSLLARLLRFRTKCVLHSCCLQIDFSLMPYGIRIRWMEPYRNVVVGVLYDSTRVNGSR